MRTCIPRRGQRKATGQLSAATSYHIWVKYPSAGFNHSMSKSIVLALRLKALAIVVFYTITAFFTKRSTTP